MSMITVIGRGHSGTRAISHTLSQSGVYMGQELNASGDLIPPEKMYDACRIIARKISYNGGHSWDFSKLFEEEIDPEFIKLINGYLHTVLSKDVPLKGWKIPETTLAYPWIVRMFPDIKYIFWVRDPRDCVLGAHITDDLAAFGIDYEKTDDIRLSRAISWKYQQEIVKAVPLPKNHIKIRFEDFILKQKETLLRLEGFLGFKLAAIPVKPEAVGRYKNDAGKHYFDFFETDMAKEGYEI